uniref:SAM domain-containing protein n=1 Tax=Onchocerca volvulus TaxID=6282 RepID=A0A8R1Y5R4_ONCVO
MLNMLEYLPFFEKANILQVSTLRLLKEADLKYIGIDNSGRQKLLKAVPYLSKNIPMTIDENIRHHAVNVEAKYPKINEEKFRLQKTQDELLRCKMELNLKRNELARIQKENKLIHEIVGMTAYVKRLVQKLLKNCSKPGNECSSIQRLTSDLEGLLNNILIPNDNSNPTKENIPSLPTVQNNNSRYWNIQQHLPEPPRKPLKNDNTRLYRPNEMYSLPWYSKILKPVAVQRYKQTGRNPYCFQQPSVSPLPVLQSPAIIFCHPTNEDQKYRETTISLLTPVTSEYEHPSFMDGLFSKFGKNKTSTPCKQSAAKRCSNSSSNTRHQSFVHQSRKKVKSVFMRASKR